MAHSFHLSSTHSHLKWSKALKPALAVPSGSIITFTLLDGGNNQITPDNHETALSTFDFARADPAFGPVFVEDAAPGDVLKAEFLDLTPAAYGWTAVFPGFGLLADEFPEPALKMWDLTEENRDRKGRVKFKDGIYVPVRPFLGVVGVAPGEEGEFSTIPPYATGGNIDCKHIIAGSTLYLPVKVPGALFSCGDGHAAQGDGEVCGTAIETPMTARIRLSAEKTMPWVETPHFLTPGNGAEAPGQEYAALGIDADLREATRNALRGLLAWLMATKGLSRVEAYMLASVASHLKMVEVVDMPNYAIACSIPLNIFSPC
jgi:acetamidase/formamidase